MNVGQQRSYNIISLSLESSFVMDRVVRITKHTLLAYLMFQVLGTSRGEQPEYNTHTKTSGSYTICRHSNTIVIITYIAFQSVPLPTSEKNVQIQNQLTACWQVSICMLRELPVPLATKLINQSSSKGQGWHAIHNR